MKELYDLRISIMNKYILNSRLPDFYIVQKNKKHNKSKKKITLNYILIFLIQAFKIFWKSPKISCYDLRSFSNCLIKNGCLIVSSRLILSCGSEANKFEIKDWAYSEISNSEGNDNLGRTGAIYWRLILMISD